MSQDQEQPQVKSESVQSQLSGFLQSLAKKTTLSEIAIERLLGNQEEFEAEMLASIVKHSQSDGRFELLSTFEFTVPEDYVHSTEMATLAEFAKNPEERFYVNSNATDHNYNRTTYRLVPCKSYRAKIFGIREIVVLVDCLTMLVKEKAFLVGAQGLAFLRRIQKEKFPVGKWLVSFDEKDRLWQGSDGSHRFPFVGRYSVGDWRFDLDRFACGWDDDHCVLCVCDLD